MKGNTTPGLTDRIYSATGWAPEGWRIADGYSLAFLYEHMPNQVRVIKLADDKYLACFDSMSKYMKSYSTTPANALGNFALKLIDSGRLTVEPTA